MTIINQDFKQVEVAVLAHLSKDEGFIKLICDGRDIYKYFAAIMYDKPESEVTKEERDSLKIPILGISYGKGARKLSQETGKSEEWCKEFIESFYNQFPKVKELHERWVNEVNKKGFILMFDGIRLQFKYYDRMWSEVYNCWFKPGYKPTEIKNYPVQHTAFLLMSIFLSEFWRKKAIHKRDKYLLVCTVHDSIMLDCKPEYVEEAKQDLKEILDNMQNLVYNKYKEKLLVPIRADVSVGHSWYELS